ncbi:uncharacterized protein LOC144951634 [Lampetra fluviatilis]
MPACGAGGEAAHEGRATAVGRGAPHVERDDRDGGDDDDDDHEVERRRPPALAAGAHGGIRAAAAAAIRQRLPRPSAALGHSGTPPAPRVVRGATAPRAEMAADAVRVDFDVRCQRCLKLRRLRLRLS